MSRTHGFWILAGVGWMLGCPPTEPPPEQTSGTAGSTTVGATSVPMGTSTADGGTTVGPATDSSSADGGSTFLVPEDVPAVLRCSVFDQDCPRGHKCTLGASRGSGAWDRWWCVPVEEQPVPAGQPCSLLGEPGSGLDDCALGSMCMGADPDVADSGICIAFCEGDHSQPVCADEGSECYAPADGLIVFCLPLCDPLAPDCPGDFGCYPLLLDRFGCAPDASEGMGAPGDPCDWYSQCASGSWCLDQTEVPGCTPDPGCCSPSCDLGDPTPPCLPGQSCVPYLDGEPPPEHANLGICRVR